MSMDRRKMIVEAATKSFSSFGYKATTMDQVAKLANVGKGTIYTFFSNKEELFSEIVEKVNQKMVSIAEQDTDPNKSFVENVHIILYAMLDFRRKHELTIRLSHEIEKMGTKAAKEGIRKFEETMLSILTKKVEQAVNNGELKLCDPKKTAFALMKMYMAFVRDWDTYHNKPLDKEDFAELFDLYFIRGLSVK
ncbi:TetR/AcrR family transcriptional regulator [Paenibacillus larvae]